MKKLLSVFLLSVLLLTLCLPFAANAEPVSVWQIFQERSSPDVNSRWASLRRAKTFPTLREIPYPTTQTR